MTPGHWMPNLSQRFCVAGPPRSERWGCWPPDGGGRRRDAYLEQRACTQLLLLSLPLGLEERGLHGVVSVASDDHPGLWKRRVFQSRERG